MLHEAQATVPILTRLDAWRQAGWLRQLDLAFTTLLYTDGGETDETVLLLAALTSQQLGHGHICLDLAHLLRAPDRVILADAAHAAGRPGMPPRPAELLADLTTDAAIDRLASAAVVDTGPGTSPLVLDHGRLYLRRYWQYEHTVAAGLTRLLERRTTVPDALPATLTTTDPDKAPSGIDWQRIACALAARSHLTLLTGGPGTGKTTTVIRMLGVLQSLAMAAGPPLRIRLAAPTGKAAARLTESIGDHIATLPVDANIRAHMPAEVTTLHRLLGRRPGSRQFRHHRHNPLHADLVVVDEASMVDLEMMASLLDALGSQTRLVLIGDKDQLASVEAGAVMGDLCAHAEAGNYDPETIDWIRQITDTDLTCYRGEGGAVAQQTVMLRDNHRFGSDSGIGQLARAVNGGDVAEVARVCAGDFADLSIDTDDPTTSTAVERLCGAHYRPYLETIPARITPADATAVGGAALEQFARFQLLCALRTGPAGVDGLNTRIATALQRQGLITRTDGWYAGRPVMVTRNDYALGLMNGDIGITLPVAEADQPVRLRVAFLRADGEVRLVLPSRLGQVETVFAMTVHKAQGSEFNHAALLLPDPGNPVMTRELIYTAITRARDHFTLLGAASGALEAATRRQLWRASGLAERMHAVPADAGKHAGAADHG